MKPTRPLPKDYLDEHIPTATKPSAETGAGAVNLAKKWLTSIRATFHLPFDLVEEARDTSVALAGPPHRMTLAKLVRTALRKYIKELRDEHNGGERFPRRGCDLPGGRPIRDPQAGARRRDEDDNAEGTSATSTTPPVPKPPERPRSMR